MTKKPNSTLQVSLAWMLHILTASGLVFAFLAILATNADNYRMAMFWLICAAFIDGVDGTFARMLRVKEVLPRINGVMIDTVVDFMNYAVVPVYMLYTAQVLPTELDMALVGLILITSAIYYGKEGMIAEERYFVGFPVLWNVLAFFILFVIPSNEILNAFIVIAFSVLHFVPLKFAYPSRKTDWQKLNLLFSFILLGVMLLILYISPESSNVLNLIAYLCGFYFIALAVYDTYVKK